MTPDINELKLCVARMLPDHLFVSPATLFENLGQGWDSVKITPVEVVCWKDSQETVLETEWLHVCWLAEQTLKHEVEIPEDIAYWQCLAALVIGPRVNHGEWEPSGNQEFRIANASVEQRLEALCRVKCPEIFTPSSSASQT